MVFGSEVDICLVDNIESKKILINNGVKKEKFKLLAIKYMIRFFYSKQNKFEQKRFFQRKYNLYKKKIFVIALPHLAEHKLMSWKQHWEEIEYIIESFNNIKRL